MPPRQDPAADLLAGLDAASVRRDLLAWYRSEGRVLPWREAPTVYGVWVSEIMLQQTTVAAVLPRWSAFLARFPDVRALAAAPESAVLDVWRGLGYYRRARQLHRAAREIVAAGDGRFPADVAGWRALPGVGDYTAGAVASIGLGLPVAAVDTNVDRVLRRLVCDREAMSAALKPAAVRAVAAALVDPRDPGAWTQALMDLGAGPCRVAAPACGDCPLAGHCHARSAGVADRIPAPAARPAVVPVVLSLLVARDAQGLVVLPPGSEPVLRLTDRGDEARRTYGGLYRGYWRLPSSAWYAAGTGTSRSADRALSTAWARWLGLDAGTVRPAGVLRGSVTRYRQEIHVHVARSDGIWPGAADAARGDAEDPDRPLAQPDRRALALAEESPV